MEKRFDEWDVVEIIAEYIRDTDVKQEAIDDYFTTHGDDPINIADIEWEYCFKKANEFLNTYLENN